MVYVNLVSPSWTDLKSQVGKKAQLALFFKRGSMRIGQVALGQVIGNDEDGRYGYGGSQLGQHILIDMAHEGTMEVEPTIDGKQLPILTFDLTGAAPAISELEHCS